MDLNALGELDGSIKHVGNYQRPLSAMAFSLAQTDHDRRRQCDHRPKGQEIKSRSL